ncbi:MAG: YHS domain-containing protein [Planctomycetota bacterium]|jgi:YHS domain-containing protein
MRFILLTLVMIVAGAGLVVLPGCSSKTGDASSDAAKDEPKGHEGSDAKKAEGGTEGKNLKPQERCPVMGNPINKEVYVDHEGKRIYFCCPGCDAKFKQDPEKWLKRLAEMGEKPVDVPQ